MYKHILIPTDGSALADKAVEAGLAFAGEVHAKVTAFTAVPEYRLPNTGDVLSHRVHSPVEYDKLSRSKAEALLRRVVEKARAAGVEIDFDYALSDHPWEAIIAAAGKHGCDLIFMASHGHRGLSALLHGSQTQAVLSHSVIPTMVYR
jgi:nucleotide-binding universal stress UspA family protein